MQKGQQACSQTMELCAITEPPACAASVGCTASLCGGDEFTGFPRIMVSTQSLPKLAISYTRESEEYWVWVSDEGKPAPFRLLAAASASTASS